MAVTGLINSLVAYLWLFCLVRTVKSEVICIYQGTRISTLDCMQLGNSFNYLSANGPVGLVVHRGEKDLKSLDLSDCNIVNINQDAFKKFSDIESLDISKNVLSHISSNTFSMMKHLTVLNVSHNALGYLEADFFEGLDELKVLDLSFNILNIASYSGFESLPNLHILDLSSNLALDLTDVKFGNSLTTLKMSSVSLVLDVTALLNLVALKRLQISSSQLFGLPQDMLKTMPDLTSIELSSNGITTDSGQESLMGDTFKYNLKLFDIDLSSNSLTTVPRGLFSKNVELRKVDLSRNEISSIDGEVFAANENIVFLDLSFNQMGRLPAKLFTGQKNLQHLDLAHNTIGLLDANMFSANINLESLNLEGNGLKSLMGNQFANNRNLQRLFLSENHLTTVTQQTIDNLNSLISIDLRGNHLTAVSAKFFDLPNIQILNIGCNNLTQLPQDFFVSVSKSQRKQIRLGGNPWKCPCILQTLDSAADYNVEYGPELLADGTVGFCIYQEDKNICDGTPLNGTFSSEWSGTLC